MMLMLISWNQWVCIILLLTVNLKLKTLLLFSLINIFLKDKCINVLDYKYVSNDDCTLTTDEYNQTSHNK